MRCEYCTFILRNDTTSNVEEQFLRSEHEVSTMLPLSVLMFMWWRSKRWCTEIIASWWHWTTSHTLWNSCREQALSSVASLENMPPQSVDTKNSISYSRIDESLTSVKLAEDNDTGIHETQAGASFLSFSVYTGHVVSTLSRSFKSLENCPRELYINFVLKFFECYSYFAMSQILVLYLHQGEVSGQRHFWHWQHQHQITDVQNYADFHIWRTEEYMRINFNVTVRWRSWGSLWVLILFRVQSHHSERVAERTVSLYLILSQSNWFTMKDTLKEVSFDWYMYFKDFRLNIRHLGILSLYLFCFCRVHG